MPLQIERILENGKLLVAPHWDRQTKSLYFVDVLARTLNKYVPATRRHTKVVVTTEPKNVTIMIPVEGRKDHFLITVENELHIIHWDGESDSIETLDRSFVVVDTDKIGNRFNDAKCDSSGRLWAGTLCVDLDNIPATKPVGSLYTITGPGKLVRKNVDNLKMPNGLAWHGNKFFFIDSLKGTVDRYAYDQITGCLSNREVWFTFEKHSIPGLPDGMTVDDEGRLYVAALNGGRIVKIDAESPETLLNEILLPEAKQITAMTFGGNERLDVLYVVTAALDDNKPPENGAVYKITGTEARGLPPFNFKLE